VRSLTRARRGASMVETVATAFLLSFALAATAQLYRVGFVQQRVARSYSGAQTEGREALRRVTRTLRHGKKPVNPSTEAAFPVTTSDASQVIVKVPEPEGAATDWMEVRVHRSGTVLYAQRADQAAPGTSLLTGVAALSFNYFSVVGATRTQVAGAPATADEVQVTLTTLRESSYTKVSTLVNLRNAIAGSF
jgi:hypothetical protein